MKFYNILKKNNKYGIFKKKIKNRCNIKNIFIKFYQK